MEDKDDFFVNLDTCSPYSLEAVGGKAQNLGKLTSAGFPVPQGIIIPTYTYESYIKNKVKNELTLLLESINYDNEENIEEKSKQIKKLILNISFQSELEKEIVDTLQKLDKNSLWAVRSSAAAEDLPEASFAGQQDSFLNVSAEQITTFIKKCWASYWNKRAITYRHN
ncbi:MAG: phosphoenolpyruvate synthase, partial [Candidatus Thermoplasmatota archaeon]|nr:phosphoenolpyruvate synthase [Candidatus Thermoplasmatota archaeon]